MSIIAASTLVLTRSDVAQLLSIEDCITAVEQAFLRHAQRRTIAPGILGTHVEGGGFHVKAAGMLDALDGRPVYAMKVNANFPGNPDAHSLPTIQGVLALFDATNGRVLALMDSIELTIRRTAAATAVAAKYLAPDVVNVAICGCGEQARSQLRALACVREIARVVAIDAHRGRAEVLASEMAAELGVDAIAVDRLEDTAASTNCWITCTTSTTWFLGRSLVAPGSFVAAVGADNPHKQEIEPALLATNVVVADVLEQCATIGDLHHAVDAGLMQKSDVRAELADVVSGSVAGRQSVDEIIVFDSTGTALQDVAAATVVYERAVQAGACMLVELGRASNEKPATTMW